MLFRSRPLLEVTDTGVGMAEEVARRATEPLFTTKPGGRGTGLGLAVSHDVLRAVGGRLSLTTAPGEGTTVTLTFGATAKAEPREPARDG